MQYRPDFLISDQSGTPVAIVEVKALNAADAQRATRYLRNLFAHGGAPQVHYVLLLTEDHGYLWTSPEAVLREQAPVLRFPMDPILEHYLPSEKRLAPIDDIVLEPIAGLWLENLVDGITNDEVVPSGLQKAGLVSAVRNGLVSAPALA